MSDELKPCPFCGEAAATAGKKATRFPWFKKVACSNDGCGAHFAYWHPDEWNRRADRRAQPAEAEVVGVVAYAYIDETPEDYLRTKPFVLFAGPDGSAPGPAMAHQRLEALVRLSALSAVTAERDRLESTLIQTTTRHFAQQWKDRADDKKLDECLSEGIAMLEAERDRLLSDNASLRGSCKALGEENKQLKRENKRQGRTIAAMAAKEV